ncbi:MAG TPA: DUF2167 domain-containing protein [Ramlibacter sp.]
MSTWTRPFAALLACVLWVGSAQAQNATAEQEQKQAFDAARKVQVTGPANVALRDQATLKLPAGFVFIPQPEAEYVMRSMGNRGGDSLTGLVFPMSEANWFAVVRYIQEGHIKDDDAKDWNADELLASLREGTEASNEERTKRGYPAMEVAGWAEAPKYDAATHRLVWSASTRDKGAKANDGMGVNYNTYALGREGYISLNLVTALADLPQDKQAALQLLGALEFNQGRRYADFNGSTDKVAAYGLAALVAGAAAKKLGLFAVLLAFAAKFAKVIVVAVGGAAWGIAKMFGRKRSEPTTRIDPVAATDFGSPKS